MMKNIVAFDIETTGVDKTRDHIIQISMVKFNPETYEVIDTYDSYVRPIGNYAISVPAYIKHKIRPEHLVDKPTIKDIADDIIKFFDDCDILTFNGNGFDIPFLNKELESIGKHIDFTSRKCYDSCLEERKRHPNNLSSVYERYTGNTMEEGGLVAHNSLSDVAATIEIFKNQNESETVNPIKIYGDSGMIKDMIFEDNELPCFSYGKYRALPLKMIGQIDKNYIKWAISSKSGLDEDTKKFIESYLEL